MQHTNKEGFLEKKDDIPLFTRWIHKDGGEYIVAKVLITEPWRGLKIPIVVYKMVLNEEEIQYFKENNISNIFIRTIEHFKSSFRIKK